ncbi:MAG: hypothetical protein V4629_02645 [Pseudomonadota bacterium]
MNFKIVGVITVVFMALIAALLGLYQNHQTNTAVRQWVATANHQATRHKMSVGLLAVEQGFQQTEIQGLVFECEKPELCLTKEEITRKDKPVFPAQAHESKLVGIWKLSVSHPRWFEGLKLKQRAYPAQFELSWLKIPQQWLRKNTTTSVDFFQYEEPELFLTCDAQSKLIQPAIQNISANCRVINSEDGKFSHWNSSWKNINFNTDADIQADNLSVALKINADTLTGKSFDPANTDIATASWEIKKTDAHWQWNRPLNKSLASVKGSINIKALRWFPATDFIETQPSFFIDNLTSDFQHSYEQPYVGFLNLNFQDWRRISGGKMQPYIASVQPVGAQEFRYEWQNIHFENLFSLYRTYKPFAGIWTPESRKIAYQILQQAPKISLKWSITEKSSAKNFKSDPIVILLGFEFDNEVLKGFDPTQWTFANGVISLTQGSRMDVMVDIPKSWEQQVWLLSYQSWAGSFAHLFISSRQTSNAKEGLERLVKAGILLDAIESYQIKLLIEKDYALFNDQDIGVDIDAWIAKLLVLSMMWN